MANYFLVCTTLYKNVSNVYVYNKSIIGSIYEYSFYVKNELIIIHIATDFIIKNPYLYKQPSSGFFIVKKVSQKSKINVWINYIIINP